MMIFVYHQKLDDLWCAAAIKEDKILATSWSSKEQTVLKQMLESVPSGQSFQVAEKPSQLAEKVLKAVRLMIEGKDVALNFKYEMSHMPKYSRRVLGFLTQVPLGYVTTYGALAKAAGGGARAVGNVMASNPLAPLIPCHRVVRSNYTIGGYGGEVVGPGISMKLTLLQRENRGYKEPTKIKVNGSTLQLFPASFVRKN
jgi:methylated-DNA-[protein]-cysteine S-methyltransferase